MRRRAFALLLLLLLVLPSLSGCWNKVEIEEWVYVLALGIDRGETGKYRMTAMLAIPQKLAGKEDGSGKDDGAVVVTSAEAPSVVGAVAYMHGYIGRRVNLSHVRAVFIHEELARDSVRGLMDELLRFRESRRTILMVVTREPASEFLSSMNTPLHKNPMRYLEQMTYHYQVIGVTPATSILNALATRMNVKYADPVAYYAAMAKQESGAPFEAGARIGGFEAGELPRTGGANVEMVGAAVFRGDRMVGVLTGQDARYLLMLQDRFRHSYIVFPDPGAPGEHVAVQVNRGRPTRIAVDVGGDRPRITVRVRLELELEGISSGIDYSEPDKQGILEQGIEREIKQGLEAMIRRTQEWGADVVGFGRYAISRFPTVAEWERYDWPSKYREARVDVDVQVTIRRFGLTLSPVQVEKTGVGE